MDGLGKVLKEVESYWNKENDGLNFRLIISFMIVVDWLCSK